MAMTIHGDKELIVIFDALPKRILDKLLRTEMRGALRPVLELARTLARKRFGAMAGTLKIKAMKRKKGRVGYYIRTGTRAELEARLTKHGQKLAQKVLGGGRYRKKTRARLQAVARTLRRLDAKKGYYPAHIELGTKKRKAYPYLRPAFDSNINRMVDIVSTDIGEAIDEK